MISDLAHFVAPSALYDILLVFPPTNWWEGNAVESVIAGRSTRAWEASPPAAWRCVLPDGGLWSQGNIQCEEVLALPLFCAAVVGCMFGGFRSLLILFLLTFALVFWLEAWHAAATCPA